MPFVLRNDSCQPPNEIVPESMNAGNDNVSYLIFASNVPSQKAITSGSVTSVWRLIAKKIANAEHVEPLLDYVIADNQHFQTAKDVKYVQTNTETISQLVFNCFVVIAIRLRGFTEFAHIRQEPTCPRRLLKCLLLLLR